MLRTWVRFAPPRPYLSLLKKISFRHTEAIVFDQIFPSIANYWTRTEALSLLEGLPVSVRHITHARGNSCAERA